MNTKEAQKIAEDIMGTTLRSQIWQYDTHRDLCCNVFMLGQSAGVYFKSKRGTGKRATKPGPGYYSSWKEEDATNLQWSSRFDININDHTLEGCTNIKTAKKWLSKQIPTVCRESVEKLDKNSLIKKTCKQLGINYEDFKEAAVQVKMKSWASKLKYWRK